jgi:tetratricopeptide (TPR) repeat protein
MQAADVLAWALYKSGRYEEALPYAEKAMKLGTQDPTMLFHVGMVHRSAGNREEAAAYLEQAVELNPRFFVRYAEVARQTLEELRSLARR